MINKELKNYIETQILPEYNNFDKGHDINHINGVVERSFNIAKELPQQLDLDMVYAIACFHDYGMKIERKNHNLHSATLLKLDENLKKWFNDSQINIMAEAVEDHSTSKGQEPRSIYGKIVCDADKDNDLTTSLTRVLEYSFANFPHYKKEEHFEACFSHMCLKYGKNGLVKFWLSNSQNNDYLGQIGELVNNKALAFEKFDKITNTIIKK